MLNLKLPGSQGHRATISAWLALTSSLIESGIGGINLVHTSCNRLKEETFFISGVPYVAIASCYGLSSSPRRIMDPLSISAAVLAFVGTSSKTAKLLRKLSSQGSVSTSVKALEKELSDLRVSTLTIQDLVKSHGGKTGGGMVPIVSDEAGGLASSLERAKHTIDEAHSLLKPLLDLVINTNGPNWKKWYFLMKKERKLGQLRQELHDIRNRLNTMIGMLSL